MADTLNPVRRGDIHNQTAAVDAGRKVPHKLAQAKAGGRDSKRNQSVQNDARALRALSRHATGYTAETQSYK